MIIATSMSMGHHDFNEDQMASVIIVLMIMVMLTKRPHQGHLQVRRSYTLRDKPMSTIMRRVLFGSENSCLQETRMRRSTFFRLCDILRHRQLLRDTINMRVEEQLAIFLSILGQGSLQRGISNAYDRAQETISRYFNKCLYAIGCLCNEYIKYPSPTTPPEIMCRPNKFYPCFKDCIGAIDGTHITATVPNDIVARFCGRKDHPT